MKDGTEYTAPQPVEKSKVPAMAKVKAAVANNGKEPKVRSNDLQGKTLYHLTDKGMNKEGRRYGMYQKITDGMTFEAYLKAGGNAGDLRSMVADKKVEAR